MKDSRLKIFSIVKFIEGHEKEVCDDIRAQYEKGVANCFLFMFNLTPEGRPAVNKAKILCEKYMHHKKMLEGIPVGVLVQASIGHGRVLGEETIFQKLNIARSGRVLSTICPLDEGFQEYIADAFRRIAECEPCHIMLDDDYRILRRGEGGGCACPLHLKQFAQITGKTYTRQELMEIIESHSEEGKRLEKLWIDLQIESMVNTVKIMRAAIDSVDPAIPGSFCCCGQDAELGLEVSEVLAGEGNPRIVRINNGHYCAPGPRGFSRVFLRGAHQVAKLKKGGVDYILAETDTCPQNRYSTSATMLHAHFAGCIMEGMHGAKQWITRSQYEFESGKAYRKILSKYSAFYDTLFDIVPTLKWRGFRIPLEEVANHKVMHPFEKENEDDAWSTSLLERMGLPMYFSAENGGVLCLEGKKDEFFSDEQILQALKGTVMLASDEVERLWERGFGEHLGVKVRKWEGKFANGEYMPINGTYGTAQTNIMELVPTSDKTKEWSTASHTLDNCNYEHLFPAVTVFENSLGGKVIAFAGSPKASYDIMHWGYLNYSRKLQLAALLKEAGERPLYYKEDEEVYLRVADMPDNRMFVALFNIGLDIIENLEFSVDRKVKCVSMLMPNGDFQKVDFKQDGDDLTVYATAQILAPVVLVIA